MIQYSDFRGVSLEHAKNHFNNTFDFAKHEIVSLETKVAVKIYTIRVWYREKELKGRSRSEMMPVPGDFGVKIV